MSNDGMKNNESTRDPDLVGSEIALRRAARRAREQARHSTGYVVVYKDGKIVEECVGKRTA